MIGRADPTARTSLDQGRLGFAEAVRVAGVVERSFSVGERAIVTRFAGNALIPPLTAAIEHHPAADPGLPRLTINLWDVASTGVPMPSFPESARDGGISAVERVAAPGPVRVAYLYSQRALCVLEIASGEAYYCAADASDLPYWELGAPLLTLLQWWMGQNGRQLVHGAALGNDRGGVLLVGPGGSGKSSTALATLSPGVEAGDLRYAGDDYCLVGLDPRPWAYSLYGTGKVTPDQARRFPDLVAGPRLNAGDGDDEKALFVVSRRYPERMVSGFPVVAMVVPFIGAEECRMEPLSAGHALRALAPSTVLQLQGAGRRTFATLAALTRSLPTYALRLAPDPREAPPVIASLIDRLMATR